MRKPRSKRAESPQAMAVLPDRSNQCGVRPTISWTGRLKSSKATRREGPGRSSSGGGGDSGLGMGSLLQFQLIAHQLVVMAAKAGQGLVVALLDDPPLIQHHDLVGIPHGAETVGD